jgi:hypothetical protein
MRKRLFFCNRKRWFKVMEADCTPDIAADRVREE